MADEGEGAADEPDAAKTPEAIRELAAEARQKVAAAGSPEPADKIDAEFRQLKLDRSKLDLILRKCIGFGVPILMGLQVLIIDGGFLWYGAENGWKIPAGAVVAWLGAGTIQVIGSVTLVVVKDLFPGSKDESASG
jgi:hypothetical protein